MEASETAATLQQKDKSITSFRGWNTSEFSSVYRHADHPRIFCGGLCTPRYKVVDYLAVRGNELHIMMERRGYLIDTKQTLIAIANVVLQAVEQTRNGVLRI